MLPNFYCFSFTKQIYSYLYFYKFKLFIINSNILYLSTSVRVRISQKVILILQNLSKHVLCFDKINGKLSPLKVNIYKYDIESSYSIFKILVYRIYANDVILIN